MDVTDRIQDIINILEDALSYNDIDLADDARKELVFLAEELESTYDGIDSLDDEDY
jgi:hypothetical protein